MGDERPLSFCNFSPDSKLLAIGSLSGTCKLSSVPECQEVRTLRGHDARVGSVVFHPQSRLSLSEDSVNLASGAADGRLFLWSLTQDIPIAELRPQLTPPGPTAPRICRVAFHPSGRYIGSTSMDSLWRFWDVTTEKELLYQEGHHKEAPANGVYAIAFHPHGALAATGGFDHIGRLWDLRIGKSIMVLEGHTKPVLGVDFPAYGYHLATASDDNTVKLWDIRNRKCLFTIPAHSGLVSNVKFQPEKADFLLTCSYDKAARLWSTHDWTLLRPLVGHSNYVMHADIAPDSSFIATCSYDRTFRLWSYERFA